MKAALIVLILAAFCLSVSPQQTPFPTKGEMAAQLAAAPCKYSQRLEAVKKLFQWAGATDDDMTVAKFGDLKNVVITKKGESSEKIILAAHYDKVADGCGAIDNWTGITVIANLYRTVRGMETRKTYIFVAFDREEAGLLGSAAMAKSIPKEERINYCAMVNLDSFGFSYPQVMENTSTLKMRERAETLAKELKMPFGHAAIQNADADSSSFRSRDIPSITFHGMDNTWPQFLHTSKDKYENINMDSVFVAYSYVLRFLAVLDSAGCTEFRKQ